MKGLIIVVLLAVFYSWIIQFLWGLIAVGLLGLPMIPLWVVIIIVLLAMFGRAGE